MAHHLSASVPGCQFPFPQKMFGFCLICRHCEWFFWKWFAVDWSCLTNPEANLNELFNHGFQIVLVTAHANVWLDRSHVCFASWMFLLLANNRCHIFWILLLFFVSVLWSAFWFTNEPHKEQTHRSGNAFVSGHHLVTIIITKANYQRQQLLMREQ